MLQSLEEEGESLGFPARAAALRAELAKRGLDGFIVPRQDEFQGEYVAPYAERLRWLTGFAGSWGMAILMKDRGAIFVDGRYTIQVREQVDVNLFKPQHLADEPPSKWMETELKAGEVLGYDPWLLTPDHVKRFAAACEKAGAKLVAVERQSHRCGLGATIRRGPRHRCSRTRRSLPAQSLAEKLKGVSAELAKSKSTRWSSPRPIRSPGSSTSAAAM